jgi:hypothetical protein
MRRSANRAIGLLVAALVVACVVSDPKGGARHRWWAGLGPVLPHDTFPADCSLCHLGEGWNRIRDDFYFDHSLETGVPLNGAHARATCLRCHNDRGPVAQFMARGCGGCHDDVHLGDLGPDCAKCHVEHAWEPQGQISRHQLTRFPLTGAHLRVACHKCHPGSAIGNFVPTDTECVTCHRDDLVRAVNPPHIALGFVDRCDRCHQSTDWHQAEAR